MPELPDLEVFKANVYNRLTSKRLIGLSVFNPRKVQSPKDASLQDLIGSELLDIDRTGKELLFDFGDINIITAHLMLSGEMSIVSEKEAVDDIAYKVLSMTFENETLVFSDRGELCTIKYMPTINNTPDAFGRSFSLPYFCRIACSKPRMNVKAFLIDQHIVKGIGNAYADEILWAARISPHSLIGKIPDDQLAILHGAIRTVLADAILEIKSIAPDIISGEVRSFLKVHNKALKKTETGAEIIVEKVASKTTYYTNEQVLYT